MYKIVLITLALHVAHADTEILRWWVYSAGGATYRHLLFIKASPPMTLVPSPGDWSKALLPYPHATRGVSRPWVFC
jgi:hypothetical protein